MSEKTEQPTPRKILDGRKEGQVVKSVEITSGLQLVSVLIFFHFFSELLLQRATALMVLPATLINQPFDYALTTLTAALAQQSVLMFAVFGGMLMVTTISAILLQIGLVLASNVLGVKGKHINPVNNLKKIFSISSLIELLKSTAKVTLLCLIFIYIFYFYAGTFQQLPYCGLPCALPVFMMFTHLMWYGLILFYIVLGAFDYLFQQHNTNKQQRMSKEEVKQEHKDTEGDPHIKNRRREFHREIQSGSLAKTVKKSTVVVRNPTHIAVCLGYHPTEMPIPRVLEKGNEAKAADILRLADSEKIPVVENIPLARALFKDVNCGDAIPEILFEPVAALLRIVLKQDYDTDDT